MGALARWMASLEAASRNPRLVLVLALAAAATTVLSLVLALRSPDLTLRVSAGSEEGQRHRVAEALQELAAARGVTIVLEPTPGSNEALERVADGRRPEGSGTRHLALELLELVHMEPGRDFEEDPLTYDELTSKPSDQLPDAFFHVSTMPSPVAEFLLRRRGYRLLPLPYARALHLRDVAVREGTIPAYAYGVSPAHPAEDTETVATRMLVVAHQDTSPEAVRAVLEVITSDAFGREAPLLARISHEEMAEPELRLHRGADEWLRRNDPLITPELIDNAESMRSFLVSLVVALFLGWRWWRARQQSGFEKYLHQVTDLEREVLKLELAADLDLVRLLEIQRRLGGLKNAALEGYGAGKIGSADLLNSFLAHVNDVRAYLNALILHERERLEKKARRRGEEEEDEVRRHLWLDAVGELDDED